MLRNSLITSRKMLTTWSVKVSGFASARWGAAGEACDISRLLLAKEKKRQRQENEPDHKQRRCAGPERGDAERLGEYADRDRLVPSGGKRQANDPRAAGERRNGG